MRAWHTAALQRRRDAGDHPAGADRAAERVDPAAGLLDQLAADSHVALKRILVVELIGPERVALGQHPLDLGAHRVEQRRRDLPAVARHDEQVGAEGPHRVELLLRESIGRHRRESVALHGADQRQRRTGAAAGELDDAHAGTQGAAGFGAFDHRQRHAVFVRAGRVVVLEFDEHVGAARRDQARQADERRAADRVQDGFGNRRHDHLRTLLEKSESRPQRRHAARRHSAGAITSSEARVAPFTAASGTR